ncbi:hypothetical protein [Gaetbulibacter aestuarii]|uniref:Uncharacterized protein n=1 Tax=Gaetbulibacter aestuarii TaxID=1502358 RepID=A0ABW7MZU0_9FLAO
MSEKEQTEYFFNYLFEDNIQNLKEIENDPPDFEFIYNGSSCSLEHTRYYNSGGEKIKAKKVLQNEIIKGTYDQYNLKDNPPITVGFVFENHINLKRKEISSYCKKLSEFIITNVPKEFNDDNSLSIEFGLPKYLKRLSISKYSHEYSFWQSYKAYMVKDLDFKRLNNLIQKKSINLSKYSKCSYRYNWLLIIIEREEYSNYSQFSKSKFLNYGMTENNFDRIYLASMKHRPECFRIK